VSPRLAFRKATDLLPVTGPVSSHKEKATDMVAFSFYPVNLVNPANPVKLLPARLKADMSILDRHRESHVVTTKLLLESICL